MTTNAGVSSATPQPGTGIHGGTTGLEDAFRNFANGPILAAALAQRYAVIPRALVLPGNRLPVNGTDGQIVDALVDIANGIVWRFRYTPIVGLPYQWLFLGGGSIYAFTSTNTALTASAFTTLSPFVPSIPAPFAGDYIVDFGAQPNVLTVNAQVQVEVLAGTVGYASGSISEPLLATQNATFIGKTKVTGIAAGTVLTLQYAVNSGGCSMANRWASVTPIRCAGG